MIEEIKNTFIPSPPSCHNDCSLSSSVFKSATSFKTSTLNRFSLRWSTAYGKPIQKVRDKFAKARASVQKKSTKGTRSSRRRCRQLLKRLSGKEQKFQSWLNHNISRAIINQAKSQNAIVAIEDLTGIRERTNTQPRNKTERRRSNSWAFYQLRFFLEYKGIKAGVEVVAVPPQYTSQTCVRFVLEKLRNERIPGSNRVTFGLSSHFKPLLDDNLIVMWVREPLKSPRNAK